MNRSSKDAEAATRPAFARIMALATDGVFRCLIW